MAQLEAEFQVKTTQSNEEIGILKNQLGLAFREINQLKEKLDNVNDIKRHIIPLLNSPKPSSIIPRTCYEIKSSQTTYTAGIYKIDPSGLGKDPITVYCDSDGIFSSMETNILHVNHLISFKRKNVNKPRQ